MKFQLPLLAVRDVERSKKFYCELFDQQVVLDFGENVTFSGGFAIQQDFDRLLDFDESEIVWQSKNMELYFETENLDEFLEKLTGFPQVKLVHPPKKYDWEQRVARIFDPDGHIIEIGESMAFVARRLLAEGKTPEETASITQYPLEFVHAAANHKIL